MMDPLWQALQGVDQFTFSRFQLQRDATRRSGAVGLHLRPAVAPARGLEVGSGQTAVSLAAPVC